MSTFDVEVDATGCLASLALMQGSFLAAIQDITSEGSKMAVQSSQSFTPVGVLGNSTNPPGELKASIQIYSRSGGGSGRVVYQYGTDLIYSKQREFGGDISAKNVPYLVFSIFGTVIEIAQVSQVGAFYD